MGNITKFITSQKLKQRAFQLIIQVSFKNCLNIKSFLKMCRIDLMSTKSMQRAIADSLGIIQMGDLNTIGLQILILGRVANPSLYQGTPKSYFAREKGVCTVNCTLVFPVSVLVLKVKNSYKQSLECCSYTFINKPVEVKI